MEGNTYLLEAEVAYRMQRGLPPRHHMPRTKHRKLPALPTLPRIRFRRPSLST